MKINNQSETFGISIVSSNAPSSPTRPSAGKLSSGFMYPLSPTAETSPFIDSAKVKWVYHASSATASPISK